MVRRKTTDEDLDRLAENLLISEGDFIQDRDSFDVAMKRYLGDNEGLSNKSKNMVFDLVRTTKPSVSEDRLFKEAGGEDLKRDRLQTAKEVVRTRKEFIEKGADKVDFAGFDVRRQDIRRFKQIPEGFEVPARVKKKRVFAKKTSVRVRGKTVAVHRDKFGRFASVK